MVQAKRSSIDEKEEAIAATEVEILHTELKRNRSAVASIICRSLLGIFLTATVTLSIATRTEGAEQASSSLHTLGVIVGIAALICLGVTQLLDTPAHDKILGELKFQRERQLRELERLPHRNPLSRFRPVSVRVPRLPRP